MKPDEELGYISPEEFIPIAESKGLILEIGDKVLEMVAETYKSKELQRLGVEYIEVNLSGIQACAMDIDKRLKKVLDEYQIEPSNLNLEITETATIDSGAALKDNMRKLREMNFSFSMDDFGTGYSNLAQMSKVYYDLVKIDKSLIWPVFGMGDKLQEMEPITQKDEMNRADTLLQSVVDMLGKMQYHTVAEGVETKEMADYLIENGIDHLQGYYYAKPLPIDKYIKFMEEKKCTYC